MGKLYDSASAAATPIQKSADRLELPGPALLTYGSALAGAVLGWMLTAMARVSRFAKSAAKSVSPHTDPIHQ